MKTIVKLFASLALIVFTASFVVVIDSQSQTATAISGKDFNPGRIIDDEIFYNDKSMTAPQIQSFLNSKVPSCDTNGTIKATDWGYPNLTRAQFAKMMYDNKVGQNWQRWHQPPYTCLKDRKQNTPQMEAASGLCEGIPAKTNRTAAEIIYDVATACGINPQVLIVLLEKEQSLVTDTWPLNEQYNKATGFDCPDTTPCDPAYAGFFYQTYYAARQFKVYKKYPNDYNYIAGRTNRIYWHPDLSRCGSSQVYIENQATAALYIYTPYRPNNAALNNMYGTGDSCSSYGNRNFWRLFTDWFGSTLESSRRLEATLIDAVTDQTGEQATIGYSLIKKPSSNVTIRFNVSSVSNIKIVGSSMITITPSTWNRPELNTIKVIGLNNPDAKDVVYAYIGASKPISNDKFFASLSSGQMEKAKIINLTSNSTAIYRLYSSTLKQHRFTPSVKEKSSLLSQGWTDEGVGFYTCRGGSSTVVRVSKVGSDETRLVNTSSTEYAQYLADGFVLDQPIGATDSNGNIPVYERYDPVLHRTLYTTSINEGISAGYEDKGIAFYACSNGSEPVYRLYNPIYGKHFITNSESERNRAISRDGYRYENISFIICNNGNTDVYRLYRKSTNSHLYTTSESERDRAVSRDGFVYEGIAFKLCNNGNTDVYRLYRKSTNSHLYTTSESERDSSARKYGFVYEGVAFKTL